MKWSSRSGLGRPGFYWSPNLFSPDDLPPSSLRKAKAGEAKAISRVATPHRNKPMVDADKVQSHQVPRIHVEYSDMAFISRAKKAWDLVVHHPRTCARPGYMFE